MDPGSFALEHHVYIEAVEALRGAADFAGNQDLARGFRRDIFLQQFHQFLPAEGLQCVPGFAPAARALEGQAARALRA